MSSTEPGGNKGFGVAAGYPAQDGQIVDATLIPVPKQRNTRTENQTIKQGYVPPE